MACLNLMVWNRYYRQSKTGRQSRLRSLTGNVLMMIAWTLMDWTIQSRPLSSPSNISGLASTIALARGDADAYFAGPNRLYGIAFEILPFLVEQVFDPDDTRSIYLSRHMLTHLFFIAGGFCCYLLTYRMTGSRLLGLFAMLLFLLHPRMYSYSFWNSKDLPFLSMFMIALFSIHWAFRKGTIGAFLVCGAVVGLLVNIRVMGVMLLPAALALRACDLHFAVGWAERKRVIISGTAFALAAAATYYATMPYLWTAPLARFGEILTFFAWHTTQPYQLFQGQYVDSGDLPARYLPIWIGITTPPWALLLAGLGAASICWQAIVQRGATLRNNGLRFELLLVASAALPMIAVIALESVMYNDWRHMYFLWAPLCLLAMAGLRQFGDGLASLTRRSGWPWNAALPRAGLAALAALSLAVIAAELIRLHPYQQLYFNPLVDRTTPEYLRTHYETDYYRTGRLEGVRYILDNHPGETIQLEWRGSMYHTWRTLLTLSEAERGRFRYDPKTDADYYVISRVRREISPPDLPAPLLPPVIYDRKVYNNTIMSVAIPDLSRVEPTVADAYREIYRTAALREPALRTNFDFYLNEQDNTLTLVNEDCAPGALNGAYRLRVYPVHKSDLQELPGFYLETGYVFADMYGVRFDGKCLMQATLPDYDIGRIAVDGIGEILSDAYLSGDYLAELRRQYNALTEAEPAIRSEFAVYIREGELGYARDECAPADTAAHFFLHIIPAELAHLPVDRREYEYDNYDFKWWDFASHIQSIIFDDKCMATIKLPDYELHGIRTGQYLPGVGRLWGGAFYTDAYYAARASELAAQAVGEPASQDFFSVYYDAGALTYIREDCAPADTEALFYLHLYPLDAADLPANRRQYGFGNADFEFGLADGVQYGGRCLASIPLPDYPIDRIHTGQYLPETGRLWSAEFAVEVGLSGEQ